MDEDSFRTKKENKEIISTCGKAAIYSKFRSNVELRNNEEKVVEVCLET